MFQVACKELFFKKFLYIYFMHIYIKCFLWSLSVYQTFFFLIQKLNQIVFEGPEKEGERSIVFKLFP